jgi:hypothetical protein
MALVRSQVMSHRIYGGLFGTVKDFFFQNILVSSAHYRSTNCFTFVLTSRRYVVFILAASFNNEFKTDKPQFLTAVIMASCGFVAGYRRFGRTRCCALNRGKEPHKVLSLTPIYPCLCLNQDISALRAQCTLSLPTYA